MSSGHKCVTCPALVYGMVQKCDACRAKELLCRKCGRPHGGAPKTTKQCEECRRHKKSKPRSERNPPWTPEEDERIREAYATHNAHTIGPRLRELFPTRPRWSLTRRAQELGAATVRRKEPPWSAEEHAFLMEWAWMSPGRLTAKFREHGYSRTTTAIAIRLNRYQLRKNIDSYTAQAVARLLNVDFHKVSRWIADRMLRAERRKGTGGNDDRHHITTADVRSFLLAHPEQYELGKLERAGSKMWFLEMVTLGRISEDGAPAAETLSSPDRTVNLAGERVTLPALADICGRSVANLIHRIDGLGMSVQEAAFGAGSHDSQVPSKPVAVFDEGTAGAPFGEVFSGRVLELVDQYIRRRLGLDPE